MKIQNVFTAINRDVSNPNETYTLYILKGNGFSWCLVRTTHDTGVYTNDFLTGSTEAAMDTAWTNRTTETYEDDLPQGIILPGLTDFFAGGS